MRLARFLGICHATATLGLLLHSGTALGAPDFANAAAIEKIDTALIELSEKSRKVMERIGVVAKKRDTSEDKLSELSQKGIPPTDPRLRKLVEERASIETELSEITTNEIVALSDQETVLHEQRRALISREELLRVFANNNSTSAPQAFCHTSPASVIDPKNIDTIEKLLKRRFKTEKFYHVFKYNCHDFAQEFMLAEMNSRFTVGIVSCQGGQALASPLSGHTVNYIFDDLGPRMCVTEPQQVSKVRCWQANNKEQLTKMPDISGNPEAEKGIKFLCGNQFEKFSGPSDPGYLQLKSSNGSVPYPPGMIIATKPGTYCANQMQRKFYEDLENSTLIAVKKNTSSYLTSCTQCCDEMTSVDYQTRVIGTDLKSRARFKTLCYSFCSPVLLDSE